MKKSYTRMTGLVHRLRQLGLAALLVGGATVAAQAQTFTYGAVGSSTIAGTYTALGATATPIATTNTDDANSAAQNIGFTFNYNGTAFTQFVLNTNGLIRLGAAAPSKAAAHSTYAQTPELGPANSTDPADVNLLMPFNIDLVGASAGASYSMAVTGTQPNRVCTIQWSNVSDKATAVSATNATVITAQYSSFSFQVKLYETTNQVDFVYGVATAGTGTTNAKYVAVGLKGSSSAAGQDVLATKASTGAWSTTTFFTGPYLTSTQGNAHNIRQSAAALPDAGRTYRFTTIPVTDVAISTLYTVGKLAVPTTLPHAVQAVVSNEGALALSNITVALSVTGANTISETKTVAALAAGASTVVTFTAYPTTLATGTNNLSVTATTAGDGNAANNTATYTQLVTTNRLSYINPGANFDYYFDVDNTTTGGVLANKFTINTALGLTDATITFNSTTQTGITYKVVVYDATGASGAPGTLLYTSPTQTRPAAGGPVVVNLNPLQVPAGSFYVGVQETSTGGAGVLAQTEDPLRPGTFYLSFSGSTPWYDLSAYDLPFRFAIEVGLGAAPNCAAPTGLAVSAITPTTAMAAFTAATGTSSYQLIYGPTGFNPNAGGTTVAATTSPVTLTGLTPGTAYQIYIRSTCTAGGTSLLSAPVSFTTACDPNTTVSTFPYNQNFDTVLAGQSLPCGITTLDANGDGTTWRISTENPNSGIYDLRYQGAVVNNVAADDWFFTPPLALPGTAGTRYQVAFRYRAAGVGSVGTSNYTESLEVKSGLAATVAGQTNLLYTNTSINNLAYALANGTSTPVVAYLPAGASTQYVGFHVKSAANQSNLYIDDLSVTAVVVTATSPALMKAITVFPNPSTTGVFDLEIHGANAQKGLDVEVVNNLGQRVYVGTARDNYTNSLDLSRLATGLYHLKVRTGDDYMMRQISIVK
ncbi:MAG: T9SS type A sorting domain-containing protein [Janthinobacterium lividum]